MFYDDEGVPYTQETIQEAQRVDEYRVNDTMLTQEEYDKARQQYRAISILDADILTHDIKTNSTDGYLKSKKNFGMPFRCMGSMRMAGCAAH